MSDSSAMLRRALSAACSCCSASRFARSAASFCSSSSAVRRADLAFEHGLLLHQRADAQAVTQHGRARHQRQRQQAEPPALPPGRRDRDRHGGRRLAPDAVLVAGPDPEHIGARIEVGVGGEAFGGVGIDPAGVEAVEPVGVAVAARRRVVQAGELEGEYRFALGQRDLAGAVDRRGEALRLVKDEEIGDAHHRRIGVVADRVRHEGDQAVDAAEMELAVRPARGGADEKGAFVQAVLGRVVLVLAGGRIVAADALGHAGPQASAPVFQHGADRQRFARIAQLDQLENRLAGGVLAEAVQAAGGADPELAARRHRQAVHAVVAQAVGVARIVAVMGEDAALAVEAVEAIVGADPEDALRVLDHLEQGIVAETLGVVRVVAPGLAHFQVVAELVQAGARDRPQACRRAYAALPAPGRCPGRAARSGERARPARRSRPGPRRRRHTGGRRRSRGCGRCRWGSCRRARPGGATGAWPRCRGRAAPGRRRWCRSRSCRRRARRRRAPFRNRSGSCPRGGN